MILCFCLALFCFLTLDVFVSLWGENPYPSSVLSCLQLLLDILQGNVPLWGTGDAVGHFRYRGGRLQDDLKGLAWGALVNGLYVHICMRVQQKRTKERQFSLFSAFLSSFRCFWIKQEAYIHPTFIVAHDIFAALGVQTGADERENWNLLHLLFVSCGYKCEILLLLTLLSCTLRAAPLTCTQAKY